MRMGVGMTDRKAALRQAGVDTIRPAARRARIADRGVGVRKRGIDRVIEVLEHLYAGGSPLRPNQIATAVKAPRSSVYEIVDRLLEAGFLEGFDDEGRVFLGRRLHYFGAAYVNRFDLMREAELQLRTLTEKTNATSQLCTLEGRKYVVALMRQGGHHFRISGDVGRQVPLPWTASGPLLVSNFADDEILRLIPPEDYRLPDGRRLEPEAFLRRVHLGRKRGLSRLDGQLDTFVHCMAAPVLGRDGRCVATLCLVVSRADAEKRGGELAAALVAAAAELSEKIGSVVSVRGALRPLMSGGR
jgi:DNA-binding IclR family transcriptional regulator